MKKIISIIITFVLGISLCTTITSCTNQSDNTSKISHTHHYVWVDNGDGTHKQHCQNQGCQEPDINYGNHTYDSNGICICGAIKQEEHIHNYIWVDNGDGTHKQHCENEGCDAIDINEGPHNFNDEGICIQCGATREEEIPDGQLLKFQLNEDGTSYSVLGANENSITDIVIPSTYEGLPVTTIAENAFRIYENQRFGLTSIFIPQSITTIENYAFFNATSLTSIVIPESVINLGSQLFRYSAIKKAEFYSSIVPEHCFYGSTSLEEVYLGDLVETIAKGAFRESSLTKIEGGKNLTTIGEYAFYQTNSTGIPFTQEINLESVKTIKKWAFYGATIIGEIKLTNLESLEEKAFYDCDYVTSVIFGNKIKTIPFGAFHYNNLTNLNLGNSVETIEGWAFHGHNLTSLVIPDSVTSIGDYAFAPGYRSSLISMTVGANLDQESFNYAKKGNEHLTEVYNRSDKVVVPSNILVQIDSSQNKGELAEKDNFTFYTNSHLNRQILVDYLGEAVDLNENSLPSSSPNGKTYEIGYRAFSGIKLYGDEEKIIFTIPDSVTVIHEYAFCTSTFMKGIVISKSVKKIGDSAFNSMNSDFNTIFYKGSSKEEWDAIEGSDLNSMIHNTTYEKNMTIYYYSETNPSSSSLAYWHYVNGVPTPW